MTDGALRHVARREQAHEAETVAAGDLGIALDRNVPHRHIVQELPVFALEIVVADRQEHVVVDRVAPAAVALRRFEIRRAFEPRAALDEAHIERFLHLHFSEPKNVV